MPILSKYTKKGCFADDSNIWQCGASLQLLASSMQNDLNNLTEWAKNWGLKINGAKSKAIIITRNHKIPTVEIKIDDEKLKFENNIRVLGIILDKKLTWRKHIEAIRQ